VRGRAVWLVTVVAVVVGLLVLHSPICTDGSTPAAQVAAVVDIHGDHDLPAPDGALMTCLALVLSVLVAAVVLVRPERGVPARVRSSAGRTSSNAADVRPPLLAELCVLRI
jgi:hypothetical protein